MPITDKNRKILWARSGNRCAYCKKTLVIDRTSLDSESVVGEECHIISSATEGPRYDPEFPQDQSDSLVNLILLCSNHHKMIDNQCGSYSAEIVRSKKAEHEAWVEARLTDTVHPSAPRIARIRKNIPTCLPHIDNGKALFEMAAGASAHYFHHEPGLSDEETELVGEFAQEVEDWIDISASLGASERMRAVKRIQDMIEELELNGFFVFAANEEQCLEGGVGAPTKFPVLHLSVFRSSGPNVRFDDSGEKSKA